MGSVRLRVVPGQAAAVPGVHATPWVFLVVAVATLGALAQPASHRERPAERSNLRDSLVGGSLVRLLLVLALCAAVKGSMKMRQQDCAPSWNWSGVERGITSRPSLHLDEGAIRTRTRPISFPRTSHTPSLLSRTPKPG